jgi:hypothetical protein
VASTELDTAVSTVGTPPPLNVSDQITVPWKGRQEGSTFRDMAVKLVVLYAQPGDADAFDRHQAAMDAGFGSDEGAATAADYQKIAPPGSRMFVAVDDG